MSARVDYPLVVAVQQTVGPNMAAEIDRLLNEVDFLRQWSTTLADRRPTDTREAEPTRK